MNPHRGMGDWALTGFTELQALGEGTFGRVVLARHDGSGRLVAIKYLFPRYAADSSVRAQFRREADILRRVLSPHVAALYEFVETPQGAAIVMEAVAGVSLRDILARDGALVPEAALALLKGSLLGLEAAHAAGTVHRDYKPGNVLVQPNRQSKLVDFGIAVLAGHAGQGGTPAYMAPEQWRGGPATPATDVYAATCVFFLCITGSRPYEAEDTGKLCRLHESAEIPVEALPEQVRGLVARGMAKDAAHRPASAAAFVAELESAAAAGYGPDWETRGWQALAATAGALVALSPLAWLAAGTGSLASGGTAGAVAGGTTGSVFGSTVLATTAGKVAAGLIGIAVITGATVAVISSAGDEPSGPQVAVRARAETYAGPDFDFNGQYVAVSGLADPAAEQRANEALLAPVNEWIDYTREGIRFSQDLPSGRPDGREPDGDLAHAATEARLKWNGPNVVSVLYVRTIESVQFGNRGGYSQKAVTVDLATGRLLNAPDVFTGAATDSGEAAKLEQRILARTQGGLCQGQRPISDHGPLAPADLTDRNGIGGDPAVQAVFTPEQVEFLVYTPLFGHVMACDWETVTVPYADLTDLIDPSVRDKLR